MKAQFELSTWLSENKSTIVEKYNKLTSEKFFNGVSIETFTLQVVEGMERNNPKSANRAASLFSFVLGDAYMDNSKVYGIDKMTERLRAKYNGTAYMALI